MNIGYWQFFEYLSLIMSLVYYKGLKAYSLQLMVPFLIYICCSETVAAYYVELGMPTARGFVNVYHYISAAFFFVLFRKMIRPKGRPDLVYKAVAILSMLFFLYDLLDSDIYQLNSSTVIISFTQQVILSLLLVFKLSFDETRKMSLVQEPYFWIAAGVLIFSLVTIVTMGLQTYIYENRIRIFGKSAYMVIIPVACVVLYSCYAYAFYLAGKMKNSHQQWVPA